MRVSNRLNDVMRHHVLRNLDHVLLLVDSANLRHHLILMGSGLVYMHLDGNLHSPLYSIAKLLGMLKLILRLLVLVLLLLMVLLTVLLLLLLHLLVELVLHWMKRKVCLLRGVCCGRAALYGPVLRVCDPLLLSVFARNLSIATRVHGCTISISLVDVLCSIDGLLDYLLLRVIWSHSTLSLDL